MAGIFTGRVLRTFLCVGGVWPAAFSQAVPLMGLPLVPMTVSWPADTKLFVRGTTATRKRHSAQSDAPTRAPPRVQKGGCSRWGHDRCENAQHVRGRRGSVCLVLCTGHRSTNSRRWRALGPANNDICWAHRPRRMQVLVRQLPQNSRSTGTVALPRTMCVCPGSSRRVPFGSAAATAACAFFMYSGLLPPTITRAGTVTPDR